MSRTDVHRPWRVQVSDPYNRHRLMVYAEGFVLPLYISCGCNMCTQRIGRKARRRSERVTWRAARQEVLKLCDREDVDVPPPGRAEVYTRPKY